MIKLLKRVILVPKTNAIKPINIWSPILNQGSILLMSSVKPTTPANKAGIMIDNTNFISQIFENTNEVNKTEKEIVTATDRPPIFGIEFFWILRDPSG